MGGGMGGFESMFGGGGMPGGGVLVHVSYRSMPLRDYILHCKGV